jgi:hypothetical protein
MSMNGLSLALLISSSSSLLLAFSRFLIIANTKSETATIHMIMVSKLFIIQTLYRWYGKSIDKFSYSNQLIAQRYEYIFKGRYVRRSIMYMKLLQKSRKDRCSYHTSISTLQKPTTQRRALHTQRCLSFFCFYALKHTSKICIFGVVCVSKG